jgi:ABC-type dipeptide/oligopeptide/nickel transport system ATPase component
MNPLLQVNNLSIEFRSTRGHVRAVNSITWSLHEKETLAIVGESGSGKSVTALALTRLLPAYCQVQGEILYGGENLLQLSETQIRQKRGKEIAYIFQEPSTSLNPVFSIGYQIAEAVRLHCPDIKKPQDEVVRLLDLVGIRQPALRAKDYPHQLSGGMQQRAMIAMALACRPKILVADEPTTALDVTIQAQILELLKDLQAKLGMSVILITHNFGIVSGFAQRVAVMFRGDIVEQGVTQEVLRNPQHAYTQALIACVPKLGQRQHRLTVIDHQALV